MRRLATLATASALGAALLTFLPASATAAGDDPVIDQAGDTITYSDPALDGERTARVEGTLRIVSVDRIDGGEYLYAIEQANGESVAVELAEDLPLEAANGAIEAQVTDQASDSPQLATATVEAPQADPQAGLAPRSDADHRVYLVRVTGMGGTLPSTSQAVSRLQSSVLDEWVDESDGAIDSFTVDAADARDLTRSATGQSLALLCSMDGYEQLWTKAASLYPSSVVFDSSADPASSPNHLVVLISGCSTTTSPLGVGTVGGSISSGGAATLLWEDRYIDGTAVHELGHNFSLGHANLKPCATCAEKAYHDLFSVMGFGIANNQPQALDTLFRERLGLTVDGEVDRLALPQDRGEVTSVVTLAERGAASGMRAARLEDPSSGDVYWVEYRGGSGRDAGARYASGFTMSGSPSYDFDPGVTITQDSHNSQFAEAIELVPDGSAGSFATGRTFTSTSGRTTVEVLSAGSGVAQVAVTMRRDTPRILTSGLGARSAVERQAFTRLGTWPSGTQHSYEWTVDGVPVSTDPTYTPSAADLRKELGLEVVSRPSGGEPFIRASEPVTIERGLWSWTPAATISGTVARGRTVTANKQVWTPTPTYYVTTWYVGGKAFTSKEALKLSTAWKGRALTLKTVGRRDGFPTKIYWTRAGQIS